MKPIESVRATWIGGGAWPTNGMEGEAWPATGYDDPESAQFGAYCFQPDEGDGDMCYCNPRTDLEM